ncbi:MAG: lipopolysaccharide transport periplasmic protein LptA, partial [Deltaproteobacteria bacterium]|nr:lipopolysaccharide transport periplasmic protein LptA [Deltaproteobacteria bacterium]
RLFKLSSPHGGLFFLAAFCLSIAFAVPPGSAAAQDRPAGPAGRPVGRDKKDKKNVIVTSDTMEGDRKGRLVVFRGNVVAEEDYNLCADELRVYYDESEEIKEMTAAGNVRMVRENKRARGEKAVYDRARRAIVITGHARARQCSDVVEGERITFFLDDDRVTVEGPSGGRVRATIMPGGQCLEKEDSEEFKCGAPR